MNTWTNYINMIDRTIDRRIKYIPKNSKYAKYAGIDAAEFGQQQIDKLKDKYHGKEVQ